MSFEDTMLNGYMDGAFKADGPSFNSQRHAINSPAIEYFTFMGYGKVNLVT